MERPCKWRANHDFETVSDKQDSDVRAALWSEDLSHGSSSTQPRSVCELARRFTLKVGSCQGSRGVFASRDAIHCQPAKELVHPYGFCNEDRILAMLSNSLCSL